MKSIHPMFNKIPAEEQDFLKSDYCGECGGEGFIKFATSPKDSSFTEYEIEQCEECERLHRAESYADLMHDMAKGN